MQVIHSPLALGMHVVVTADARNCNLQWLSREENTYRLLTVQISVNIVHGL